MIHHRTSLGLAVAAVLVGACSAKDKGADSTATTTSVTTSSTATTAGTVSPAPSPDSGATAGGSASSNPAQFTDANILAKESAGDSGEVAIATMAKGMATSPAVKAYAERLIADHSKGQKEVAALAKKLSLAPQPAVGDTTTSAISHAMTRLQGIAKGAAFDTAFVNHEVEDHQQDIKDGEAMAGAAKDAQVKALVQKSLPELHKHLDEAQKLSKAKG